MLYLSDLNPDADLQHIQHLIARDLSNAALRDFAEQIVTGVRSNVEKIDESIESVAQNWRIERMAPTDRNVIRIAVWEMRHLATPSAVALNEAIELAREFGSENSAAFVNGILDRLTPEKTQAGESDTVYSPREQRAD